MGIRLVRANSDTPNVLNSDDALMLRHALKGKNGVLEKIGNEFANTISGLDFIIGTGQAVIDGWQTEINGSGETLTLASSSTLRYFTIYLKVDLSVSATQTSELVAIYNTSNYPAVPGSDDLSVTPDGVAYLGLYTCQVQNGSIFTVTKLFNIVEIELKLKELIFSTPTSTALASASSAITVTISGLNLVNGKRYLIEGEFSDGGIFPKQYFQIEFIYDTVTYSSSGWLALTVLPLMKTSIHAFSVGVITNFTVLNSGSNLAISARNQELDGGSTATYSTGSAMKINKIYNIIEL
jgi:hypothetical protein